MSVKGHKPHVLFCVAPNLLTYCSLLRFNINPGYFRLEFPQNRTICNSASISLSSKHFPVSLNENGNIYEFV